MKGMDFHFRERAGCSWFSEANGHAREQDPASARHHDRHLDDLAACDSWLCVCGGTDSRGGSWETCDETGRPMEPTVEWPGNLLCTACGRIYARNGDVLEPAST